MAANPPLTYAASVYQQLRKEILSGELESGDRLGEAEIAARMSTSQGPVREALARLRAEGLIVSFAHRGSYVTEISEEEARDAYLVRASIERLAVRLTLPTMTSTRYALLAGDIREMERAADADDFAENLTRDMDFHRRLYEWSGSQTLLQFWDIIEVKIRKFATVASSPVFNDLHGPVRSHHALIKLMKKGYSSELESELERHVMAIWLWADAQSAKIDSHKSRSPHDR